MLLVSARLLELIEDNIPPSGGSEEQTVAACIIQMCNRVTQQALGLVCKFEFKVYDVMTHVVFRNYACLKLLVTMQYSEEYQSWRCVRACTKDNKTAGKDSNRI